MAMSTSQPMMTTLTVDHTPFRRVSFGLTYQWLNRMDGELDLVAPEVNVLAFRHNALDWQANLFLTGAAGAVWRQRSANPAGLVMIEADAESRRWYVLGAARYLRTLNGVQDLQALGRVGLAPFVAEYEQINPWFVVQYQYLPAFHHRHMVTPMIRLLYQGVLLEVGASLQGMWSLNFSAEL
jgi:hypothetical protein